MSTASGAAAGMPHGLELTQVEATLKRLLLDVAEYVDGLPSMPSSGQTTLSRELSDTKLELRFTGGWVRDKLLQVDSHDIDVGINKMTGYQFGLVMKDYLDIPGNVDKYSIPGESIDTLGSLHKIAANPEKSKHLETVTTRILGLDIDLVNLRKETYSQHSRNPQMEFGTAKEDASRRDATVNAMFYNLNTSKLEDLTERGYNDMQNKIMRTPLDPYQTFKDDPLRVLRLIRFASRLNYSIDPEAEQAMNDKTIQDALKAKISRERVGTEVEKMLKGNDPHRALMLIDRLGLYTTVFTDPTRRDVLAPDTTHWKDAYDCAQSLMQDVNAAGSADHAANSSTFTLRSTLIRHPHEAYAAWILAALTPWSSVPTSLPAKPSGMAQPPLPALVAREGIKADNRLLSIIKGAFKDTEEVSQIKDKVVSQKKTGGAEGDSLGRDDLGMALRRWGVNWRSHVILAILLEAMQKSKNDSRAIFEEYGIFVTHLKDLDLLEVTSLKPLLDGNQLRTALDVKAGPWMKAALEVVMAWQLRHPGSQDTAAAVEEVNKHRDELEIK